MSIRLQHPCPGAYVTQRFSAKHPGLDLAKSRSAPILAAEAGVVTVCGWDTQGYGNRIDIEHAGVVTRYGHLASFAVALGQRVQRGQVIGGMGNTGNVIPITGDGTHLHWEVIPLPRAWDSATSGRVDPEPWLEEQEVTVVGSKLGIQVQNCGALNGPSGAWVKRHAREGGVTHVLLIDPDVLSGDPWPGVKSMGRLVFNGDPDRPLIKRGAAGARDYVAMCKPRWDKARWVQIWHPQNEPFTGNPENPTDLDPMRWLTEFSIELVRLAHIEGILMGVGVFSTGCPAGPRANPMPTIEAKWRIFGPACDVADALVVHEYGMDTMERTPENEWHIGHYKRGATVLRAEGRRIPPIWVTEHFIDRAGNAQTDGWRVKLGGNEVEAMRQLAMRDADYAADPQIEAVTPFTWLDYNWPSFTITESMSERIMALRRAVAGQPLPEPEPEPVGALVNGDFEGGFSSRGAGELYVADGWTPFWADPIARWYGDDKPHYDFRPEYKRCGDETNGPKRAVTGHGQQWFNTYAGHRAGIWQQVAATPGQKVTAGASMMSWHTQVPFKPEVSLTEDWIPCAEYEKRIGIDPTGGTDWQADSVVWSPSIFVNDTWLRLAVSAVAQAEAVTLFIYGAPKYAFEANNCYVDDVTVTLGEPPVEPPVNVEQAIGDAIQAHIIPLNPNAALEKAGAALGLLPASDEVRDVPGYVAQAFRGPGERQWQFVAYCADSDWGNVKWFKRAN